MRFKQKTNIDGVKYLVRVASNGKECEEIARSICNNGVRSGEDRKHLNQCLDTYLDYINNWLGYSNMADCYGVSDHTLKGWIETGRSVWESVEWTD